MGHIHGAVRLDYGHPLGNLASIRSIILRLPRPRHHLQFLCRANPAIRRWVLGDVPRLRWGRPVLGLRLSQRERRWSCEDVGYADRPSPSDTRWPYRTRHLFAVR